MEHGVIMYGAWCNLLDKWEKEKKGEGKKEQFDENGLKVPFPQPDGTVKLSLAFEELKLETDMRPVDLESSDNEIEYQDTQETRNSFVENL